MMREDREEKTRAAATAAKPVPLLLNEKAGALHATAGPDQMRQVAEAVGLQLEVATTTGPDALRKKLRELVASGAPQVAIAGGDGTVHLAVQELAYKNTSLAIIPQGTANNFATALRLPQELSAALRVVAEGQARQVDLGFVCGEFFTETAGVGLFADALSIYGHANKNAFRALRAIFKIILSLKASRVRLTIDGCQVEERAVMCVAANSYRMGYAMPVAPGAKVTDAELDVVVLGDLRRSELLPYFRAIRAQVHSTLPKVQMLKGKHIKIESSRRMPVHCDDKVLCTTPVAIEVQPRALSVIVDRL